MPCFGIVFHLLVRRRGEDLVNCIAVKQILKPKSFANEIPSDLAHWSPNPLKSSINFFHGRSTPVPPHAKAFLKLNRWAWKCFSPSMYWRIRLKCIAPKCIYRNPLNRIIKKIIMITINNNCFPLRKQKWTQKRNKKRVFLFVLLPDDPNWNWT